MEVVAPTKLPEKGRAWLLLGTPPLWSFIAVADTGSYTRAAEVVWLSQPAVYQHVRQLEDRLGTRLIEQRGKRAVLTDHGRAVYRFARRLKDEADTLLAFIRDDQTLTQGHIRVAAGTTFAEFLLPALSIAFQENHPGISIAVAVPGTPKEIDEGVANRSFDLGVHSEWASAEPGVTKTPFLTDTLVGIAVGGHPFTRRAQPVTAGEIVKEQMVLFSTEPQDPHAGQGAAIQRTVSDWLASAGASPVSRLHMGSLEGMKNAVRLGAGVAIVSQYAIGAGDSRLSAFPLADPPQRHFFLVTRDVGWESSVVRAFRQFATSLQWLDVAAPMPGAGGTAG